MFGEVHRSNPAACCACVRYRPQLRPVFEINPIRNPCSESEPRVSSTSGKVAGGRETMAPWIASSTAVTTPASFSSSPANRMKVRTCSSGGSSRCSAHILSSRSPWRSYAPERTEGAGRRPCSRSRTSSRPIRNARIVPESDLAGMTAIVPHQSNVTPVIVISRLDVEDDYGDPLLRLDGEAVPRHGLDHELQLVPLLVDQIGRAHV